MGTENRDLYLQHFITDAKVGFHPSSAETVAQGADDTGKKNDHVQYKTKNGNHPLVYRLVNVTGEGKLVELVEEFIEQKREQRGKYQQEVNVHVSGDHHHHGHGATDRPHVHRRQHGHTGGDDHHGYGHVAQHHGYGHVEQHDDRHDREIYAGERFLGNATAPGDRLVASLINDPLFPQPSAEPSHAFAALAASQKFKNAANNHISVETKASLNDTKALSLDDSTVERRCFNQATAETLRKGLPSPTLTKREYHNSRSISSAPEDSEFESPGKGEDGATLIPGAPPPAKVGPSPLKEAQPPPEEGQPLSLEAANPLGSGRRLGSGPGVRMSSHVETLRSAGVVEKDSTKKGSVDEFGILPMMNVPGEELRSTIQNHEVGSTIENRAFGSTIKELPNREFGSTTRESSQPPRPAIDWSTANLSSGQLNVKSVFSDGIQIRSRGGIGSQNSSSGDMGSDVQFGVAISSDLDVGVHGDLVRDTASTIDSKMEPTTHTKLASTFKKTTTIEPVNNTLGDSFDNQTSPEKQTSIDAQEDKIENKVFHTQRDTIESGHFGIRSKLDSEVNQSMSKKQSIPNFSRGEAIEGKNAIETIDGGKSRRSLDPKSGRRDILKSRATASNKTYMAAAQASSKILHLNGFAVPTLDDSDEAQHTDSTMGKHNAPCGRHYDTNSDLYIGLTYEGELWNKLNTFFASPVGEEIERNIGKWEEKIGKLNRLNFSVGCTRGTQMDSRIGSQLESQMGSRLVSRLEAESQTATSSRLEASRIEDDERAASPDEDQGEGKADGDVKPGDAKRPSYRNSSYVAAAGHGKSSSGSIGGQSKRPNRVGFDEKNISSRGATGARFDFRMQQRLSMERLVNETNNSPTIATESNNTTANPDSFRSGISTVSKKSNRFMRGGASMRGGKLKHLKSEILEEENNRPITYAEVLLHGRGMVGETCLHLCFLMNTPVHQLLIKYIIHKYGHMRCIEPLLREPTDTSRLSTKGLRTEMNKDLAVEEDDDKKFSGATQRTKTRKEKIKIKQCHLVKYVDASYTAMMYQGERPIHIAIVNQNFHQVKLLVESGCEIGRADEPKWFSHSVGEYVNAICTTGLFFRGSLYFGGLPLSFAVIHSGHDEIDYLLEKNADPSLKDQHGNNLMHIATLHNQTEMIKHMSTYHNDSFNVFDRNYSQFAPIALAAYVHNEQAFKILTDISGEILWKYGPVRCMKYPLLKLDALLTKQYAAGGVEIKHKVKHKSPRATELSEPVSPTSQVSDSNEIKEHYHDELSGYHDEIDKQKLLKSGLLEATVESEVRSGKLSYGKLSYKLKSRSSGRSSWKSRQSSTWSRDSRSDSEYSDYSSDISEANRWSNISDAYGVDGLKSYQIRKHNVKSCLTLIVEGRCVRLFTPVVKQLLEDKWQCYAAKLYYFHLAFYLWNLFCILAVSEKESLKIIIDDYIEVPVLQILVILVSELGDLHYFHELLQAGTVVQDSTDESSGNNSSADSNDSANLSDWKAYLRFFLKISNWKVRIFKLRAKMEIYRRIVVYFLADSVENVLCNIYAFLVLCAYGFHLKVPEESEQWSETHSYNKECHPHLVSSRICLGVASIFGWLHFLHYLRAIEFVGPFVVMIKMMIRRDVAIFLIIYICVVLGFSHAFRVIFQASTLSSQFQNLELYNPLDRSEGGGQLGTDSSSSVVGGSSVNINDPLEGPTMYVPWAQKPCTAHKCENDYQGFGKPTWSSDSSGNKRVAIEKGNAGDAFLGYGNATNSYEGYSSTARQGYHEGCHHYHHLYYQQQEDYSKLYQVLLFVFRTSIGDLSFNVLDNLSQYAGLAVVLYSTFILVSTIILFNLLIAMMADTYSRVRDQAASEYMLQRTSVILNLERSTLAQLMLWLTVRQESLEKHWEHLTWYEVFLGRQRHHHHHSHREHGHHHHHHHDQHGEHGHHGDHGHHHHSVEHGAHGQHHHHHYHRDAHSHHHDKEDNQGWWKKLATVVGAKTGGKSASPVLKTTTGAAGSPVQKRDATGSPTQKPGSPLSKEDPMLLKLKMKQVLAKKTAAAKKKSQRDKSLELFIVPLRNLAKKVLKQAWEWIKIDIRRRPPHHIREEDVLLSDGTVIQNYSMQVEEHDPDYLEDTKNRMMTREQHELEESRSPFSPNNSLDTHGNFSTATHGSLDMTTFLNMIRTNPGRYASANSLGTIGTNNSATGAYHSAGGANYSIPPGGANYSIPFNANTGLKHGDRSLNNFLSCPDGIHTIGMTHQNVPYALGVAHQNSQHAFGHQNSPHAFPMGISRSGSAPMIPTMPHHDDAMRQTEVSHGGVPASNSPAHSWPPRDCSDRVIQRSLSPKFPLESKLPRAGSGLPRVDSGLEIAKVESGLPQADSGLPSMSEMPGSGCQDFPRLQASATRQDSVHATAIPQSPNNLSNASNQITNRQGSSGIPTGVFTTIPRTPGSLTSLGREGSGNFAARAASGDSGGPRETHPTVGGMSTGSRPSIGSSPSSAHGFPPIGRLDSPQSVTQVPANGKLAQDPSPTLAPEVSDGTTGRMGSMQAVHDLGGQITGHPRLSGGHSSGHPVKTFARMDSIQELGVRQFPGSGLNGQYSVGQHHPSGQHNHYHGYPIQFHRDPRNQFYQPGGFATPLAMQAGFPIQPQGTQDSSGGLVGGPPRMQRQGTGLQRGVQRQTTGILETGQTGSAHVAHSGKIGGPHVLQSGSGSNLNRPIGKMGHSVGAPTASMPGAAQSSHQKITKFQRKGSSVTQNEHNEFLLARKQLLLKKKDSEQKKAIRKQTSMDMEYPE